MSAKHDVTFDRAYCLHLERITITDGFYKYIVIDAFMKTLDEGYFLRMENAVVVVGRMQLSSDTHIRLKIRFTVSCVTNIVKQVASETMNNCDGKVFTIRFILNEQNCETVASRSNRVRVCTINELMSDVKLLIDRYVLYVGSGRPTKVKLSNMMTLDIEYCKSKNCWNNIQDLPITPNIPPPDLIISTYDDIMIIEVNISSREIVRLRPDRTKSNSRPVIENVIRAYNKDIKYSNLEIWSG